MQTVKQDYYLAQSAWRSNTEQQKSKSEGKKAHLHKQGQVTWPSVTSRTKHGHGYHLVDCTCILAFRYMHVRNPPEPHLGEESQDRVIIELHAIALRDHPEVLNVNLRSHAAHHTRDSDMKLTDRGHHDCKCCRHM